MTATLAGDPVYVNGEWVPRAAARVSPFDRGFVFGDGIYELVQAYGRQPFHVKRHLRRLAAGLAEVGIPNPHTDAEWEELFGEAARRSAHDNSRVYLQVTRGVAPRRHAFPAEVTPTVFMFTDELVLPSATDIDQGVAAVTHDDFRWRRGHLKTISLMSAVLASEHAAAHGALETVFVRDGMLTEGASSNMLVGRGGTLLSPVLDERVLSGVTLAILEEVVRLGLPLEYRDVTVDELRGADELMLTSSGREIVPITKLDGEPIGAGTPGPLFKQLYQGFQAQVAAVRAGDSQG